MKTRPVLCVAVRPAPFRVVGKAWMEGAAVSADLPTGGRNPRDAGAPSGVPADLGCTAARRRAFTLIELLVVIAIIAILAGQHHEGKQNPGDNPTKFRTIVSLLRP